MIITIQSTEGARTIALGLCRGKEGTYTTEMVLLDNSCNLIKDAGYIIIDEVYNEHEVLEYIKKEYDEEAVELPDIIMIKFN